MMFGMKDTKSSRLWANKRYVTWLISDTSKGLAGTLINFAIPLLTLMVTNDPAQAGIIGGVGMGVQVTSMLAGGVLADRHSRIKLMVIGSAIGAVLAAVFAAVAWADSLSFTLLLATEILMALRGGIFNTAGKPSSRAWSRPARWGVPKPRTKAAMPPSRSRAIPSADSCWASGAGWLAPSCAPRTSSQRPQP